LELLYAAGLRVSELTGAEPRRYGSKGADVCACAAKGNKERIVPYGSKAAEALKSYWPVRDKLLYEKYGPSGKRHIRKRCF